MVHKFTSTRRALNHRRSKIEATSMTNYSVTECLLATENYRVGYSQTQRFELYM